MVAKNVLFVMLTTVGHYTYIILVPSFLHEEIVMKIAPKSSGNINNRKINKFAVVILCLRVKYIGVQITYFIMNL